MKKEQLKKGSQKRFHVKTDQQPVFQVKTNRYYDLGGLVIIILLGIIIYSNSFNCSFHFDDFFNIVDNPKIRNLADVKAWWNFVPSRPLGNLTFALNYHFNQIDVRYYHLVNLVIHLINACLVWWLTRLIISSPALKDHPLARQKNIIAFFTALLFVSHPLATQSVTYIVQRLASLVAMFYLLSLAFYVKARLTNKNNTSKYLLFAGSFVLAVAAMLTKENAFTLPFAIILSELFFLQTKKLSLNLKDYRILLLIAALLCIITIVALTSSFNVFQPIPPKQGHTYTVTPLNYLLTQFSVIIKYIQLLFLPINQKLDYDFPISNDFFEPRTFLSFLVLSALMIMAIILYKKQRIISFGIFWFFLTLSVESSIIPIPDVIFEHRTYLPSFGFFLTLSSGIYLLLWEKYKYLAISILVIIIGSNSFMTYERNKVWKDNLSLWNDNVFKAPDLARPICNRGYSYALLGQWDQAIDDYSRAIRINPDYFEALFNRGTAYGKLGQFDKAIADYSRVIKLFPNYKDAFANRGIIYQNLGRFDEAIADFSRIIEIDIKDGRAYINLGAIYFIKKNFDAAISISLTGLKYDPRNASLYDNIGYFSIEKDDYDKALENFQKCLKIDINNFDALLGLALDYYYKNDKLNARKYLEKAGNIEPRLKKGMNGIAELEKSGYLYTDKEKVTLKKMFVELR